MANLVSTGSRRVYIKGAKEVGDALRQMSIVVRDKAVRAAMGRMSRELKAKVIAAAPEGPANDPRFGHPGLLKASIRNARRTRGVPAGQVVYVVYVNNKRIRAGRRSSAKTLATSALQNEVGFPYYWYMLEFGWHDATGAFHKKPFLLRTMLENGQTLMAAATTYAAKRAEKEVEKLYRRPK